MPELTACKKCKHILEGATLPVCLASPYPTAFDCYEGEYYKPTLFFKCKDINTDGNCKLFKPKEVNDERGD